MVAELMVLRAVCMIAYMVAHPRKEAVHIITCMVADLTAVQLIKCMVAL
jgi:hypothetical protein